MPTIDAVFPQLEVMEPLGAGGMGRVYKARQTHLDRIVALKVLPPELARDPAFAERFAREARALARLNHPNIVQCYDFGQSSPATNGETYFYLLLEFVDGVNLRQSMRTQALTSREALGIVPKLCDALNYAHDQGVLHRDIKPENILIDKQGRVKIADFGLARFQKEGDTEAMTLTMSGAQLGTAAYMAPEQIEQPHDVDHRADIYSLGVVFYEMLTGELPLGRFAPPSETRGVDPRLDKVVFRTLEKQADKRYQSAGEVQTQVETIAGSPTPNADAAFSKASAEKHPDAIRNGPAIAFPPSWTGLWTWIWRQPFLLMRGQLTLKEDQLAYTSHKDNLAIPLVAIERVSLAPFPFVRDPLGRCPIEIRWRDATGREQVTCLLVGSGSWLTDLSEEQELTDTWTASIQKAIEERTGKALAPEESLIKAAEITPPPPNFPRWAWLAACICLGLFALGNLLGGNLILGLPVGFVAAVVGCGIWRRHLTPPVPKAPEPPSKAQSFASEATATPPPLTAEPPEPKYSKLSLWAFGFATLGWLFLFTGPVIGCVLGWFALKQIKDSKTPLRGRGLAAFAALQAPIILVSGLLGGGTYALWNENVLPLPYPIALLALASLVFVAIRIVYRLAKVKGLWAWNRWFGSAVVIFTMLALTALTWASADTSLLSTLDSPNPNVPILPMGENGYFDHGDFWVALAIAGATAGVLFAISGLGSGALGILLTLILSVGLHQISPHNRISDLHEDFYQIEANPEPNQFPTHVDGIRVY